MERLTTDALTNIIYTWSRDKVALVYKVVLVIFFYVGKRTWKIGQLHYYLCWLRKVYCTTRKNRHVLNQFLSFFSHFELIVYNIFIQNECRRHLICWNHFLIYNQKRSWLPNKWFLFSFFSEDIKKSLPSWNIRKPILLKMNHSYSNKIISFCHKTSCHVVHFVFTATR